MLLIFILHSSSCSIDATKSKQKARYANDASPLDPRQNAIVKMAKVDGEPHVAIFAKRDIEKGEEIRYDYGVPTLPWRQKVRRIDRKFTSESNPFNNFCIAGG